MSLRLRLTLLYTTLLVGTLLTFGAVVYSLVNVILIDQIDASLDGAAVELVPLLRVTSNNAFDLRSLSAYRPPENLHYQIWTNQGAMLVSRPAGLKEPLDSAARRMGRVAFTTADSTGQRLRVLTVPLETERGRVGLLQVGLDLTLVELILRTLANLLILFCVLAAILGSVVIWFVNGRALEPLAAAKDVALQITQTGDLARRIPPASVHGDEVDMLIQAFNQTLERMEQLFTSQRRFLADVSHELRTPLTVIKGNVGLMRKFGEADEESLVSIEAEVDRLTRLVGDLLLLAQAESGRLPLAAENVELDTVLLEVFQQMRVLAGERVQVKLVEIDQVLVSGDRDRLKQVLLNLIGNSVQYTPAGGQVSLVLRKTETQAQLIITDSGPGIPAADLPHIFERFYRGEKSRKRAQSTGFGLGLSIAFWIVRNHGGYIEVSSKEGQGTRFCVWLPLKK